ncbi:calcium-binding protein [Iningainema tapete]|uniref:Calcium-binding protein n=1 Tax=Iningainema tapete BLCC-T55 TaxID=2748662 RepID=A0A8J6XTE7_9CYAN|nr:calcium-binding protein [Iningainema tapete]MBD2777216.1 calcium-binding protein [Iningainema tapete BLCC-T55]
MLEALILRIGPGVGDPPVSIYREYIGGPGHDEILGSSFNDKIYGLDGNDILYSRNGNDILFGGNGNDILYGEAGNDYLAGGNGNDVLWGGAGADKFVFYSPSEGIDIIQDYSYSQGDRIVVDKVGFGATSTSQFNYNSNTGALFFQGTQFVTLENKPADFSTSLGIELV